MNTKAAADLIDKHAEEPLGSHILEEKLEATQDAHTYEIASYGSDPIRITLCWTDPPGNATLKHDDPDSRLVNPLDLRVNGPDGSVFRSFVLDPENPSARATTGVNTRDNVEQVYITYVQPGVYYVHVSRGTIGGVQSDGWEQEYSLISSVALNAVGHWDEVWLPWKRQMGTPMSESGHSVCTDVVGNVYITGGTYGSLFQDQAGGRDVFIAKYDPSGSTLWTKQFGTLGSEMGRCIYADNLGYIYIAGHTEGALWGDHINGFDAFVGKYSSGGNPMWIRQFGTWSDDFITGICADDSGRLYIVGNTGFGDDRDMFLAKYDSSGNVLWKRDRGTSKYDSATGVCTDSFGYVYTTGVTSGSLGGTNRGDDDIFLSKHDTLGNVLWTKQIGTTQREVSAGISADELGNIYIAGGVQYVNTFISKYDSSGQLLWTRQIAEHSADNSCRGISVNPSGYVFVTGELRGDTFTNGFDTYGNFIWTSGRIGTNQTDDSYGVCVDAFGRVYITGLTYGSLDGIRQGEEGDAFLIRLHAPPSP